MVKASYLDYIFKVNGESLQSRPKILMDPDGVYLIVDKMLSLIWIWAGKNSRLFHRYIAANWAGKLKRKREFFNFKYEMIKQEREPKEFYDILEELKNDISDLDYPGQIRELKAKSSKRNVGIAGTTSMQRRGLIKGSSQSSKSRIKSILDELKEMQMHIKYTCNRMEKKISEIEKELGM